MSLICIDHLNVFLLWVWDNTISKNFFLHKNYTVFFKGLFFKLGITWLKQGVFLLLFFLKNIYLFIYGCVGLRFCVRAFSSCGKRGPLFIAVRGPLAMAASLVAEHRLQTRRLSNCGSRAQLLRGMWDLPRPGLEPVSPAFAGRFSTTAPPGKPNKAVLIEIFPRGKYII